MERSRDQKRYTYKVNGNTWVRGERYDYLLRVEQRWGPLVQRYAAQYGVDPELVLAVISHESGGNPNARSPAGAVGLMQLMPATAREMGVTDRTDPEQNIRGGIRYLRQQLDRFGGNVTLALAAYNAGPGSVIKAGWRVPDNLETQHYVRKVLFGPNYPKDNLPKNRGEAEKPRLPLEIPRDTVMLHWISLSLNIQPPYGDTIGVNRGSFYSLPHWAQLGTREVPADDPPFWTWSFREAIQQRFPNLRIDQAFDWENPTYNGFEWRIYSTVPRLGPIRIWSVQPFETMVSLPWGGHVLRLLIPPPPRPLLLNATPPNTNPTGKLTVRPVSPL